MRNTKSGDPGQVYVAQRLPTVFEVAAVGPVDKRHRQFHSKNTLRSER